MDTFTGLKLPVHDKFCNQFLTHMKFRWVDNTIQILAWIKWVPCVVWKAIGLPLSYQYVDLTLKRLRAYWCQFKYLTTFPRAWHYQIKFVPNWVVFLTRLLVQHLRFKGQFYKIIKYQQALDFGMIVLSSKSRTDECRGFRGLFSLPPRLKCVKQISYQ